MAVFRRIAILGAGAWGTALANAVAATGRAVTLYARDPASSVASIIRPATPLIACAKGIERGSEKFVTEILAEAAPLAQSAVLSGPSFAADVGRGLPTAITLGAHDEGLAASLAAALSSPAFRLYHSTDVRGIEIGGAAKNALAIAARSEEH